MNAAQLQRTVIIGTSCSGKTTFARRLAQKSQAPHIELDSIYWKPNWTPTPTAEFKNLVTSAVAPESWVLDGDGSVVRDVLWSRATTLIWLNYPFYVVAWRALSRTLGRVFGRRILWSGNKETFRRAFWSKNSILWWILKTYRHRRREYPRLFQEPTNRHLQIVVFKCPSEAERFLQNLG